MFQCSIPTFVAAYMFYAFYDAFSSINKSSSNILLHLSTLIKFIFNSLIALFKLRRFHVVTCVHTALLCVCLMLSTMATRATKLSRVILISRRNLQCYSVHSISSSQLLQQNIKETVKAKTYQKIPDLFLLNEHVVQNPNPFSFLSDIPQPHRTQLIDKILQSFIPLRPRSRPHVAYMCLLSYTLQSPNPLPLSLAILQWTLRSGCVPVPQTHLFLSYAWLERRHQSQSVREILNEMQSIGYHPDCRTCNYLISSLCAIDQLTEAVKVLKGMGGVGCIPDSESYGTVISAMCRARKTIEAVDMVKQMLVKAGLTPRQGMLLKVVAALRANKEVWRAVDMFELLEMEGYVVEFKSYELLVKGCLECGEYILAGKVVIGMTERGFIPHILVRQKVVERLTSVGEWNLACAVRKRFAVMGS